jgi:hypothetical protein
LRRILLAVLCWFVAASAEAAYTCPAPVSASELYCTFASVEGTTTYRATVTAAASGSAQANSGLALFMTLDGSPCNLDNYGIATPVTGSSTTVTVTGFCEFSVTSDRLVAFAASAQSQNASPQFISVKVAIEAFVPDSILTVARQGNGTITSLDGRIDCGPHCAESYAADSAVTLAANPAPNWSFAGWTGDCSGSARTCVVTMSAARNVTAVFTQLVPVALVVEFYNAPLDHYFVTANPLEATAIDNGSAGPGWSRTGLSFKPGGAIPVCRFYGSVSPGPNSHFYTANAQECYSLQQAAAATPASLPRWNFEEIAFSTSVPDASGCPAGTEAVHRAYNNGFALHKDSNHRYTTSTQALQDVVARGWKDEGVAMCAPL